MKKFLSHGFCHLYCGIGWCGLASWLIWEVNIGYIFLGILGSFIIDLDHLLAAYVYARNTKYSQGIRKHLNKLEVADCLRFTLANHKEFTHLFSHNVYLLLLLILSIRYWQDHPGWVFLAGAMVFHLLFDMIDDLIVKGRLNVNWFRFILK